MMYNRCTHCDKSIFLLVLNTKLERCSGCQELLSDAPIIAVEEDYNLRLHQAFYDNISEIKAIQAKRFLGFYWTAYRMLSGRKSEYLDRLLNKFDLKCNVPVSHPLYKEYLISLLAFHSVTSEPLDLAKPLHCVSCDFRCSATGTLTKHEKYHLDPQLSCRICKEKFVEHYELKRHQQVHSEANEICEYCKAPFISETRLNAHLTKQYSDLIEQRILGAIEQIKEKGLRLTYVEIAKTIGISRSLFNNHSRFKDLVRAEQDLRTRYFSASRLPREEKIDIYKEIIKEAISRLEEKNKEISMSSVAIEIGISRSNFDRHPKLTQFVNENRTAVTFVDDDELFEDVKQALKEMKEEKSPIKLKSVAEWIGRDPETLSRRDHIKEYVMKHWINHHNGKLVEKIIIDDVIPVVEKLKLNKEKISKRKVGMKLGKTADYLRKDPEINSYLESEIQLQADVFDQEMKDLITAAIESIKEDTDNLSFRKVAKFIGVDVHKILENDEYKQMVEQEIKEIELKKVERIRSAIKSLKMHEKRVTFISVHRETGLPRSFIEQNEEIRTLIVEAAK